ncbi:MAG: 3-hydroxyacyl-CoA dehydrogenase family protein [Solirubrobacteraceae bacterium]
MSGAAGMGGRGRCVALLGVGLMGSQIGCEYALAGWAVSWVVRDEARAREKVEGALELARAHRIATAESVLAARARMTYGAPPSRCELIVESLPEDLDVKATVLRRLAGEHPDALVATNTSSISISEIGRCADVSERIVGTHYWNPPLLMPLVEVVAAERTPPAARDTIVELLRGIGKRPVVLDHEVQGLLWNRLQLAVLREALWLVEHGVASAETIDEVMRDGLARRWRLTGPFETVGLGGADTFDAIAVNLFPALSSAREPSGGFVSHVSKEQSLLETLRRRRDEALAAELRAERARRAPAGDA